MSHKKFIILTPGFPGSETDTTCLPMQQQFTKALKETHPELDIIVVAFQYPYHQKRYRWFDIDVIPFGGENKGGLKRLLLRKKIKTVLREIQETSEIVGLLSFWYNECAVIGKMLADDYGIKHYCWILGQDARKENKYPKRIPLRENELIALSGFLQQEFEKNHGIKPGFVITPGVDDKLFHVSPKKNIDILGTGSLIPLKQYDIFLEVLAEVKKQVTELNAVLIGEGSELERLKIIVKKLNLGSNVTLTGELPYPEVLRYMEKAKIFLHPSSYEGFSGVCLEALHSGCQVLSFCKPMNEDIPHWQIVKTKDEMAEKTLAILQNSKTEYKNINKFPINDTVAAIMKLYEKN